MKKFLPILSFALISFVATAQEADEQVQQHTPKYFVTTNSGILSTPVGIKVGILERMGGYIGMRFGKGYKYEENFRTNVITKDEATLFAANAGVILPVTTSHDFKVHTFFGLGYGKWFSRPSQNGQTVGMELEAGLMFSYRRILLSASGNLLTGDGKPAKKDVTLGVGFRF